MNHKIKIPTFRHKHNLQQEPIKSENSGLWRRESLWPLFYLQSYYIYPTFLQVTHIDIRSVDVIRVRNSIFRFQNYSVMVICNNAKKSFKLKAICSRIVSKWYRESDRLTGYNAGVLVFFNVSFSGSRSGRLNLCLFDGIVEFQLEKHGVFTTLNTVFLKVTDWNRLGVEPNRRLVILGC